MSALITACVWRSCSHLSEVADCWRSAIGNELLRWLPGERTDDGRRARCSRAPCCRFPLERPRSKMGAVSCDGEMGEVPAEEFGGSLTLGRAGLAGLPHHQKPTRSGSGKGWSISPPCPMAVPRHDTCVRCDCHAVTLFTPCSYGVCIDTDTFFSHVHTLQVCISRTFPCLLLMRCLFMQRYALPMPGNRYRISLAEADGMNTGRTWTKGGKRRQSEPLGSCKMY